MNVSADMPADVPADGAPRPHRLPFGPALELRQAAARPELAVFGAIDTGPVSGLFAEATAPVPEAGLAVLLRHRAELAVWVKAGLDPEASAEAAWLVILLATRTAGHYLHSLPAADQSAAEQALPDWLMAAYRGLVRSDGWAEILTELIHSSGIQQPLCAFSGIADPGRPEAEMFSRFAALADLAMPAEVLMATGGDPRIAPDPATGRNGYGSSLRPIAGEIGFSSSTASTIAQADYAAVERWRQSLIATACARSVAMAIDQARDETRRAVARLANADATAETILTASGTDTELIALAVALAGHDRPVLSLVIAPDETGSGIPLAAAGRHFLSRTARGIAVQPGAAITGFDENRVRVASVLLRDGLELRPLAAIDSEVERLAEAAIAAGERVLLHLLDGAKTGVSAPSLELVAALLARHPHSIDVVVDACQLRVCGQGLAAYRRLGAMVQLTGSKFLAGPPFCGAIILPRQHAERLQAAGPLPAGLADYCQSGEWPPALSAPAHGLAAGCNLGMLARWQAALHTAAALARLPALRIRQELQEFSQGVQELLDCHPDLDLLPVSTFDRQPLGYADPWQGVTTILPLLAYRHTATGRRLVTLAEAKLIHRWLVSDLSARLAPSDDESDTQSRRLAATRCLLGQPVRLATADGETGALRLCSSARTVLASVERGGSGRSLAEIATVLAKLDLILAQFDRLAAG